jgi:iron-sulfur cluster assembly protein
MDTYGGEGKRRRENSVLILTDQAATVIEGILNQSEAGPEGGLRITGTTDGNGDASLEFAVADAPVDGDEIVREGAASVYLDEVAATVLDDKTLDVEQHGDHFHFSLGEQDEV